MNWKITINKKFITTCNISSDSFLMDSIKGLTTGRIFSGKHWSIVNAPANDAFVL